MLDLVLVFDFDSSVRQRLEKALLDQGVKRVTLAASTREVIMAADNERYDLVVLPLEHGSRLSRPLRALQPECHILLSTSTPDAPPPVGAGTDFLGVLYIPRLESELPRLIAQIRPAGRGAKEEPLPERKRQPPSQEAFEALCRQADLAEEVQQVVFSRSSQLLICGGRPGIDRTLTQAVIARVDETWDGSSQQAQIQYWQQPDSRAELLLYTRPVGISLMTLVALPQASVSELRLSSERLLAQLVQTVPAHASSGAGPKRSSGASLDRPVAAGAAAAGAALTLSPARVRIEPAESPQAAKVGIGGRWPAIFDGLMFLLRHLAFGLIVLLALIFVTYFGVNAARGMSTGEAAAVAVSDTVDYIGRLLQGDLGMTTAGSDSFLAIPVSQVIAERLPRSLALMGISLLSATIVGLTLGISAAKRGTKRSLAIIITTIIGVSVPSFFAAFLLQWAIVTLTRETGRTWLPVGGWGWDSHLILPVLVLAARPLAQITRVTFVSVRDVLDQDYIRTAYSKGLRHIQVMGWHVMRNAAIPTLVTISVSLSFILGSLPVVELYFGIPGIGFTLLGAIARQDDDLAVALLLCLGILFLVVQFLLDIGNRLVDPRSAETPAYLASKRRRGLLEGIKSLADEIGDYLTDNALTRWFKNRISKPETDLAGPTLARTQAQIERIEMAAQPSPHQVGWAAAYRNVPLMIGAILMLILLVVVLFGAYLTPHSPYTTQGLIIEDGQISTPPFEPGEQYPWGTDVLGRDMTSLILTGAQLTLTLVLLAVIARMVTGILLGAIAGWRTGSLFDRLVMGTAGIIAAYPNVLLAMLIILALGIRQGMWPFIVGLGFVGWGDTMRFVRSEVAGLRPRAFIESAVAIGARTPRIISKHIMPNLFSPLIALFALEMGAVLMLLGELGFLSIFIGGGAFSQLDTFGAPFHYSDVPEWGALLSNIRTYSRSYPWLAIYPTLAFFLAILAFNLFGEGIRRLVDDGSIVINRLINRYTIGLAIAGVLVFIWLRSNSGPVAFYRQHAEVFDGQLAEANAAYLSAPAMEGRGLGTAGMDQAAQYLADQFETMGLQPAGEQLTYFQERFRAFERLDAFPELVIGDGGDDPVYGQDFAVYPGRFMSLGQISGPVRYIGLGDPFVRGFGSARYQDLRKANFEDEILLALSSEKALELQRLPHGGLLVVVDDPALLERHFTLSGRTQETISIFTGRDIGQDTPALWITEETANRLLAGTGKTVADLREQTAELEVGAVSEMPLDVPVDMIVEGTLEERWPVQNVIGHMPGMAAVPGEYQMDHEVILVLAQYDSPPTGPEEFEYPATNDNASGVAVMLEAIRIMQETEYEPNRTFLFVAYSGEGLEGGESVSNPNISRFLQAKVGFATTLEPEAIVHVHGVGGGSGDRLEVSAGGSLRLAELFESAGRKMGADVTRGDDPIDISIIYDEGSPFDSGQDAPEVRLSWEGWQEHARLPSDTMENISADNLEDAGRTLALALMIMGREREY